jgi:hypothetical protein
MTLSLELGVLPSRVAELQTKLLSHYKEEMEQEVMTK